MEQQSTNPRRWRRFPLFWTLGIAAAAGLYQFSEATRDFKTVFAQGAVGLILLGLAGWWLLRGRPRARVRWATAAIVLALLTICYFSIDPINDGDNRIVDWRFVWQPKPDQLLEVPTADTGIDDWQTSPQDYPRFLGRGYWAEVPDVQLEVDWDTHPPQQMWRQPIGAGWSAFAIVGNYAFTQEQRGELELVVCYRVTTGEVVWTHADEARFDPVTLGGGFGGLGPRATPTVHNERVLTQGATGIVNCLDARTGDVIWSHDTLAEQGADLLMWGKSGSPLVVDDMVVVNVGAPSDPQQQESYTGSLVAYDLETGEARWAAGSRTTAYPSPVVAELAGERQVLQINEDFLTAHRAADGKVLWEHEWLGKSDADASCAQPVPVEGDRLFLSRGYGHGASLLHVAKTGAGDFQVHPLWNPPIMRVMRTKFGNVVVRDGYVYGLDGVMLQCIELETGSKVWKKRRQRPFGHGQIMLVGDVILIMSEMGELVLVKCSPDRYQELASLQVFDETNVTWNNPAIAPPYLLLRNAREAVCYRLPLKADLQVASSERPVGADAE